ncbi:MAG: ABC-F family ATP-binding cassette domain-containing protein [Gemmatimonadaceae bacterium]|nr:ABC-F family ATP-binding cassette domain-containing protein [Gemmatimonadaceae bacterium]
MTLVSLSDVGVEFGATTLLSNVTVTIGAGQRWGIVGRNGAGKSTLLKVITGALVPSRGSVARQPNLRIALLDQHRDFGAAATVWDAAAAGWKEIIQLEQSIAEQAMRLAELGDKVTDADLDRFGRDQERFGHMGGYDYHARVDAVLQGLGFDPADAATRPLASLSGGERGRVGLAAQLAQPADLLLLDEPTNHLDLDTIQWLQRYLAELDETVLVVSHDRAFLDDIADHVLHVESGTAVSYKGGYSSFVTQRAERRLALERAAEQQRKFVAKEEDYIRRNIAGQNSSQAKGRRSKLARLPRLSPPPGEAGAMALRLEIADRGGDQVLVTDKLRVTVGDRVLVDNATFTARRGDVVALVGHNGAGKSTLIATLLGERTPAAGEARVGGSITPSWFRQDLADLPLDRSIYDCIQDVRPLWARGNIQAHLGSFGFSGDEVFRSTSTLSGGERSRLALALMVLEKANFLVLDEPTNHLDVESIEALEDAIEEYEGTVLLVSHDRAFLRELATRVWAFDGTRLEDFNGPFVEWERAAQARAADRAQAAAADARVQREKDQKAAAAAKAARQKGAPDRKALQKAAESAERAASDAEAKVEELEEALGALQLAPATAETGRRRKALEHELAAARRAADGALQAWTDALEAVERAP